MSLAATFTALSSHQQTAGSKSYSSPPQAKVPHFHFRAVRFVTQDDRQGTNSPKQSWENNGQQRGQSSKKAHLDLVRKLLSLPG